VPLVESKGSPVESPTTKKAKAKESDASTKKEKSEFKGTPKTAAAEAGPTTVKLVPPRKDSVESPAAAAAMAPATKPEDMKEQAHKVLTALAQLRDGYALFDKRLERLAGVR